MSNKLTFQYCLVAFLDLVGQRDALRKLLAIPTTPKEEQEFIETARQSLGKVLMLRKDFDGFFKAAAGGEVPGLDDLSSDGRKAILAPVQPECHVLGISDSVVITVPLGGNDEHCTAMYGVELTILSICGLALLEFSKGLIFRGGLDVGIATIIGAHEVYGAALSKAYQLETEVAEYPRFVVGNGLLDFIREVEDLVPKTPYGEVARCYAGSCKRMIVQDTDGRQMLDFLGTEGRVRLRESLPAELFSRGHDFVREKHEKFLASGQEKLASRYYRLLQYYLARKAVWGT